jgi:hypothetical protein
VREREYGNRSIKQRDALVSSAVSDGNGNTLMGKGADMVTLLGVDPAQVSTDWFLIG